MDRRKSCGIENEKVHIDFKSVQWQVFCYFFVCLRRKTMINFKRMQSEGEIQDLKMLI